MKWIRRNWFLIPVAIIALVLLVSGLIASVPKTDVTKLDTFSFNTSEILKNPIYWIPATVVVLLTWMKIKWLRIPLAIATVIVFIFYGGEIFTTVANWDPAATSLGTAIESKLPGWSEIIIWSLIGIFTITPFIFVGGGGKIITWVMTLTLSVVLVILIAQGGSIESFDFLSARPAPGCRSVNDVNKTTVKKDKAFCVTIRADDTTFALFTENKSCRVSFGFLEGDLDRYGAILKRRLPGEFVTLGSQNGQNGHWFKPNKEEIRDALTGTINLTVSAVCVK